MFSFIRKAFKRLTGRDESGEEEPPAKAARTPREADHADTSQRSQEKDVQEEDHDDTLPSETLQSQTRQEGHDKLRVRESLPIDHHAGGEELVREAEAVERSAKDAREHHGSGGTSLHSARAMIPARDTQEDALHRGADEEKHASRADHTRAESMPVAPQAVDHHENDREAEGRRVAVGMHESERQEEIREDQREAQDEEKLTLFSRLMHTVTTTTLSDAQFDTLFEPIAFALLEANVAFDIVEELREALREELVGKRLKRGAARRVIEDALRRVITSSLREPDSDLFTRVRAHTSRGDPFIILFLGPNGAGKTTTIAKLAYAFRQQGLTPVIAAADTFRAAALEQVEEHANRLGVRVIKHAYGADPAAVAFDAVKHARAGKADVVLIDTAGRLQTNENLLREVEKIKRVVTPHLTLLVLESTAGSDAVEQARVFDERIGIDGFILTKVDADELGGTLLSVSAVTGKPIFFLGTGQGYEDLIPFEKERVLHLLLD